MGKTVTVSQSIVSQQAVNVKLLCNRFDLGTGRQLLHCSKSRQ